MQLFQKFALAEGNFHTLPVGALGVLALGKPREKYNLLNRLCPFNRLPFQLFIRPAVPAEAAHVIRAKLCRKASYYIVGVPGVYARRTTALQVRFCRKLANNQHLFARGKGQSALVFEQNGALLGRPARKFKVLLPVVCVPGGSGIFFCKTRNAHGAPVDILLGKRILLYSRLQLFGRKHAAGHL